MCGREEHRRGDTREGMKTWSRELDAWGSCVALTSYVSNHSRRCSTPPVPRSVCCCALRFCLSVAVVVSVVFARRRTVFPEVTSAVSIVFWCFVARMNTICCVFNCVSWNVRGLNDCAKCPFHPGCSHLEQPSSHLPSGNQARALRPPES
jgi:hypothetical protein